MSKLRVLAPALLLTAALAAACSDARQPAGPNLELVAADAASSTDAGAKQPGTTTYVLRYALRHAATAPALAAYQVSFWAVRGQERAVTVRYQGGQEFLTFTVPAKALETGLDGRRIANGDSVQITLQLDPSEFRVDFEPSGLAFSNRNPATLRVWYGRMDPDVDRDGDVDAADQAIIDTGVTYYHYDTGNVNWKKVASALDPVARMIEAPIGGFSGYVISW